MTVKKQPILGRLILILLALLVFSPIPRASAAIPQWVEGVVEIAWGDRPKGMPLEVYTLYQDDGTRLQIQPHSEAERATLRQAYGQRVRLSLLQSGYLWMIQDIEEQAPAETAVTGAQPWVTILCKFNDIANTPKAPSYFQGMYSNAYPGLDHYWREQSFGQMNIAGSTSVSQWYVLPHPRSYYVYDQNGDGTPDLNFDRAANDCTGLADSVINYANYVGINLMFNADLDGYAWGGGHYMTLDGISRVWYMTWEPPWGYADITVIAHEMGHGFGLPHSSGMYGQTYDNRWDVMSDSWTDCGNSTHGTYGCLGQHTTSYHKDILGWLNGRKVTVAYGTQTSVTLDRLAQPQNGTKLLARVPINTSGSRFYTVEVRKKVGYDVKLPLEGVIIHNVDTTRDTPAQVIDIDNNRDTGDAGAVWSVGETFTDPSNQIWIRVDAVSGDGYVVTISNHMGAATLTPTLTPTITPTPVSGVAVTVAQTTDGTGNPKTIFKRGENIQFHADVVNNTGSKQNILLRFAATGPCGALIDSSYNVETDNGGVGWVLPYTLPTDACGGRYTYTAFVTWNGSTTSANATFTIAEVSSFSSAGAQDGWIVESGENTSQGGALNNTATTLRVGDNVSDRQFRSILAFNTSTLPDNAVIVKVTLRIRLQSITGTNPFSTHGNLLIDIRKGAFGANTALQAADFQNAASKNAVGSLSKTASNGWHTKVWTGSIFPYINSTGWTQFRLRFAKDDNDDLGADFLSFYSGNSAAENRPQLIVEYYIP